MSKTGIPPAIKMMLWGKAAGRCQYDGCNELLNLDRITKSSMNKSYIAHIYADQPLGPRYVKGVSESLAKDISNLMLLCDEHHRLIDREQKDEHPVPRLLAMKRAHEERIELVTGIHHERQSHVLLFGANIGNHGTPLSYQSASQAMLPHRYPAIAGGIELGLKNSSLEDHTPEYWQLHQMQLRQLFDQRVRPLIGTDHTQHFSVFALAPMPLLMQLGIYLSDISEVDVYQRHREPATWAWQEDVTDTEFVLHEPDCITGTPVLNLSLSAFINNDRISAVLPDACSVWKITHAVPGNDFLRSRTQLQKFRSLMRTVFDRIKSVHGTAEPLHVFPAMPVAAALELGRVWMPKADIALKIYDHQNKHQRFIPTLQFN